jgi:hypothetical protein
MMHALFSHVSSFRHRALALFHRADRLEGAFIYFLFESCS